MFLLRYRALIVLTVDYYIIGGNIHVIYSRTINVVIRPARTTNVPPRSVARDNIAAMTRGSRSCISKNIRESRKQVNVDANIEP